MRAKLTLRLPTGVRQTGRSRRASLVEWKTAIQAQVKPCRHAEICHYVFTLNIHSMPQVPEAEMSVTRIEKELKKLKLAPLIWPFELRCFW